MCQLFKLYLFEIRKLSAMLKRCRAACIVLIILSFSSRQSFSQGFLKASGKVITDGQGKEIILRGLGIGGWWLQEGYMFETSGFAGPQHVFRKKIEDLIGVDNTNVFYDAFLNNFVTRRDIDSIASWGFNSIRLAMHYNLLIDAADADTFLVKGFRMIDSLVVWCRENQIYLILDLHAAPGGQGHDAPISDYDTSKPSLWESEENQDLTVMLWKEIARRYARETVIGGYDLINEPNWDLGSSNEVLRALYERITEAVRESDTNHIIFIEGNWFATDFKGLTPPWDDNMVYSFHKYWSACNTQSIQYLLDIRTTHNVPLWLGETGENSNSWFTTLVKLLDQHGIGWANWPYKKLGSVAGPLTIPKPGGYQVLLDYWNGEAAKPTPAFAYDALLELTDSLLVENCTFHPDVIHAWITAPGNSKAVPFRHHVIPGRIFCTDYDMGYQNTTYADADYQNTGSGSGTTNAGGKYRNDGVDIESCSDPVTNGFDVGWTDAGEWMEYTVNVSENNNYAVSVRYAGAGATGKLHLEVDETDVTGSVSLSPTGGWQSWRTKVLGSFPLEQGKHTLKLVIETAGFNLNYLDFTMGTGNKTLTAEPDQVFNVIRDDNTGRPVIMVTHMTGSPYKVELYDLSGRKIISDFFTGSYRFEQQLPIGLYLVAISNDTLYGSQKIIINNL